MLRGIGILTGVALIAAGAGDAFSRLTVTGVHAALLLGGLLMVILANYSETERDMKNIEDLKPGDRVKLTVTRGIPREYDALYINGDRRGCVVQTIELHTEHYVRWDDPDVWISDPTTMRAYEPAAPAEPVLVTTPADLE